MSATGDDVTQPEPLSRLGLVPKRPPPPRDELLRILKDDEPVSIGEIESAIKDGRLSAEEARELVPGWKLMEDMASRAKVRDDSLVKALGSGDSLVKALGLDSIAKEQARWQAQLKSITDSVKLRPAITNFALETFVKPEVAALRALREDIGNLATILETSGEQIGVTAKLAAATVSSIDSVHGETKALRDDLQASNKTITRLTWGLVGLGLVTIGLTAALVWLTWVLAHQQH